MKFLFVMLAFCGAMSANANPVPEFPFIILTDRIEKRVEPDLVTISFGLVAYDNQSSVSLEKLRFAGSNVIELLNKYEIPLTRLESTQIDKRVKRARQEGVYNLEILGYETTQNLNLKLSELQKYPALMNELVAIDGVSNIDALFESSTEEQQKSDMIKELSIKVRQKADILAKAQSRSVKGVYGMTTQSNFGEAYAVFSLQHEPMTYALSRSGAYSMDLTMMVPDHIEVSQQMTVIYELK